MVHVEVIHSLLSLQLIGLSVLSVGIYLQVEANKLSFIFGRDHIAGPPILIASGLFTSILAAVGFLGACLKSRALLVIVRSRKVIEIAFIETLAHLWKV